MPWLALDYQQRNIKEHLAEKFQLTTIPTLILIDADSAQIICRDARNQIQNKDKQGHFFPWKSNYFNIDIDESHKR